MIPLSSFNVSTDFLINSMVPVKEFFENFNVHEFDGTNMTNVENSILYGHDNFNFSSTTDLLIPNEIKNHEDETHALYKDSILGELLKCYAIDIY